MKDKIINIVIIVIMIVIANYPMYNSLKSTAEEMNSIVQIVQGEIVSWRKDVAVVQSRIESVRKELTGTINKGIDQTDNVLNKIKALESEIEGLGNKLDKLKQMTSSKTLSNKVDSVKTQSVEKIKDVIDFNKILNRRKE